MCNPSRAVPPAAQVPSTPAVVGALLWLCQSHRPNRPQTVCVVGPAPAPEVQQPLGTSTLRWSLREANLKLEVVWILGNATDSKLSKRLISSMNLGASQSFDDFLTRNKTAWNEAGSPASPGAAGAVASSLGLQIPNLLGDCLWDRHDLLPVKYGS